MRMNHSSQFFFYRIGIMTTYLNVFSCFFFFEYFIRNSPNRMNQLAPHDKRQNDKTCKSYSDLILKAAC